jgi:hypothetical protein
MPGVLFGIPVVRWIKGTAKRMENAGRDDRASWNRAWGEEYIALRWAIRELRGEGLSSCGSVCVVVSGVCEGDESGAAEMVAGRRCMRNLARTRRTRSLHSTY